MINETDYTNNPLTKEQENQIDALFTQFDRNDAPGCAVGVIQDGMFIYKKSFGMANLDYDIPITSDSKFELASVSKQFTAACIALLHLDGKLNLDDDVRKYIPELKDFGKTITINHLLHHISGIRDYLMLMLFSNQNFEDYYTNSDAMKLLCRQKELDFDPGEKYSYSNSGYLLLAEIIVKTSGKSIREYADEKIFKPLKMFDTFYNDNRYEIIKNRVANYGLEDDHFITFYNPAIVGPAGIISTVNDLQKWNDNFYNPVVGSQNLLDLMMAKGELNSGQTIDYALGLVQDSFNGLNYIRHDGEFGGFRTNSVCFPEQKNSVIILANRSDCDTNGLTYKILNEILPKSNESINEIKPENKETEFTAFKLTDIELDLFCGNYWCEADNMKRKIYLKERNLYYYRNESSESKLVPISKNELIMPESTSDVKLFFEFENEEKKFNFIANGAIHSVFKSYQHAIYTSDDLNKFCGLYYNDELNIYYQLELESDQLVIKIEDKKVSDMQTFKENTFDAIGLFGSLIKFISNEKNEIISFKIDADRAKNIRFVKQSRTRLKD